MVDDNEYYAYFSLNGSFGPADITARVGVEPTKCWRQGDTCPQTLRERNSDRWCLYSRLGRDQTLEAHIVDVLAQLDANSQAFRAVTQEFGGTMQLVGYFFREYPGLQFERTVTDGLARYSLAVDFDFYWLYSNHREDT